MWRPTYIEAIHFRTYEHLAYDFKQGESVMIYGRNMDDGDGADSNGSGKSNIMDAIKVATLGIDANVPKSDYVRDGEKYTDIEMGWVNEQYNKTLVVKRRIFAATTSSKITLLENGKENKQITSWNEGNNRILELFDMSKDDLLNYYIINQENSHSFFLATDGQKKQIISRFSDKGMIDKLIADIKLEIAEITETQEGNNDLLQVVDAKIESLKEQLEYEQKGRQESQKEDIAARQEEIDDLKHEIAAANDKMRSLAASTVTLISELGIISKQLSKINLESAKRKKEQKQQSKKQKQDEERELNKLIGQVDKILSGTVECPSCQHRFSVADPEQSVEELEQTKAMSEELLANYEEALEELGKEIAVLDGDIDKHRILNNKLSTKTTDNENLTSRYTAQKRIRDQKQTELLRLETSLAEKSKFIVDNKRVKELQAALKEKEELKAGYEKVVGDCANQIADLRYWEINFGIKGFKTYMVNSVLELLEGHVNNYLAKFKVRLEVKLNGYKKNATGEVRENIDVLVSKTDGVWHNLRRYSGGQKQRINVCGVLTLQNLINSTSRFGGVDLLILDEFFEGLDVKGQKMVLPILERSGTTTLIISHHNNDIGATNRATVIYENGVSKLAA